jgi:uncharacterized SAM-binding protein YcdF (DUF218 family)
MYMISKLLTALITPFGTGLLAGVLALLLAARGWPRLARGIGSAAVAWMWLWATPAVSTALLMQLEGVYPPLPLAAIPAASAAVVLGGAISPPSATRPFPDLHESSDRVWHAARLYHAGKAPLLVLSGGSNPDITPYSEAQAMQMLLHDLGVPDSAMLLEGASRTTQQNAEFSAALLKQRGVQDVLLVTSAMHMPRAKSLFETTGLRVLPVAIDYTGPVALGGWAAWLPDAGALEGSGRAFKEIVGRIVAARPEFKPRGDSRSLP